MDWPIEEVARTSGVTARTLRHYDAIGLLRPSSVGADGHRRYDGAALLRLQHVLVLRALGVPLPRIAAVLDEQHDETAVLQEHLTRLRLEQERLGRMADTVERTLAERRGKGQGTMDARPEELFEGFDEAAYADEARERWPEQAATSEAYTATLTEDDKAGLQRRYAEQMARMAAFRAAGRPVDDPTVQEEVDALYRGILPMWTPDRASFTGLGRTYVDDGRFRRTYDRVAPGLAEYYRDAMAHYAATRLD